VDDVFAAVHGFQDRRLIEDGAVEMLTVFDRGIVLVHDVDFVPGVDQCLRDGGADEP